MSKKLQNKVAIVTGASKGIGASIAKALAAEGAAVIVNYSSSHEDAEKVVNEINEKGGQALAVQANVSLQKDIEYLIQEALRVFKKIDILVNNAGLYEFLPLEMITEEHFYKLFNINVLGLILTIKEVVKHLGPGSSIINIGSVVSLATVPNGSVYSATKAAVDTITRSLSKELGEKRIRINAVNPGMVETEGTRSAGINTSDFRKQVEAKTPLGRIGKPEDVAPLVTFLATDDASWITGETYYLSGGAR